MDIEIVFSFVVLRFVSSNVPMTLEQLLAPFRKSKPASGDEEEHRLLGLGGYAHLPDRDVEGGEDMGDLVDDQGHVRSHKAGSTL